ncbi:MAG: helix-turn-helix transcriptional regulator [Ruminococcaceae bacterium]|nr:helix-turn-helix transcriptional regulator [Oscillospiraceae bacterium]
MNDYSFGNFLCSLRTEKGLSQSQLGAMLGVTNKAVSKWENGRAKPNTSLFPKLSEILGVSVEELFACRRLEKNSELIALREQLNAKRRKYAILSSVYFALILCLPFLLIDFICVVLGFGIPDDVAGPLGAVSFIILFIVSTVSFFIYRGTYKDIPESGHLFSSDFTKRTRISGFVLRSLVWFFLVLMIPVYGLVLLWSDEYVASVFLAIYGTLLILLLGTAVFFTRLDILSRNRNEKRSTQGNLVRICVIGDVILFPCFIGANIMNIISGRHAVVCAVLGVIVFSLNAVFMINEIRKK